MRRREFIAGIAGSAVAWPLTVRAQHPAMPVVGFLSSQSPDHWAGRLRAFRQGLSETGQVEGGNVAIEYRWAEGENVRLPALAADLVRRGVAVIATPGSGAAALAAKAATTTIPVVFSMAVDPVAAGLVASLHRPGGNLTGVVTLSGEVGPKRLELLHEVVPKATVIALLINPTNPTVYETISRDLQAAARRLGLELHVLHASAERDFDTAFAGLRQLQAGGLVIGPDAFFTAQIEQLAARTVRHAVPAIYQNEFAAAGGLMSYGGSITESFRLVGVYTGRIIKGEKAADLPVQQTTKVELIINLKVANALGLTVPLPLLGRADEVIE
jgi:putative ABC transport system substrate-binding protein